MERREELQYSADVARELREQAGKSQAEAAVIAEISKRTWQSYERRERAIPLGLVEKFCKRVGLDATPFVDKILAHEKRKEEPAASERGRQETSDIRNMRESLGFNLDDAAEQFSVNRSTILRGESGEDGKGERWRQQYRQLIVRAREQARLLVAEYQSAAKASDFLMLIAGRHVAPVFDSTETLHRFYPRTRVTGGSAAYYRYVAWEMLSVMLDAGEYLYLYDFKDEALKDDPFKMEVNQARLKEFLSTINWGC